MDEATALARTLYRGDLEHDACGLGLVVRISGAADHAVVSQGLQVLHRLEHRGASGHDPATGDGAGILVQTPDAFLRAVAGFDLPPRGAYATGIAFLPREARRMAEARAAVEAIAASEGCAVLGWREVPVRPAGVGAAALAAAPAFRQLFLHAPGLTGLALERRVFVVRKRVEREVEGVYFPSLSTRTLVYKGMLTAPQLRRFYPDLADPRLTSALALVHSRFSTNTFPSWPLAHPFRVIAHNGEINTVRGNRGWMRAREALLASEDLPGLARALPVLTPGASDSASFDEVVELLTLAGRSLPHALCMMVPEAWEHDDTMSPARRAFFQYHACLMEPWDGPAAIGFTDGTVAGAVVDRNGLRPARWWRTDDGLLVLASEVGVLDIAPERVVEKGALQPGRMLLVDTATGRLVPDEEIKAELAAAAPYQAWLDAGLLRLDELAPTVEPPAAGAAAIRDQVLFGYGDEDLRVVLGPMAATGAEPVGSMGSDTPPAVLSTRPRLLFDYFTQGFAQVTNPPLDSLWEELVTSVGGTLGPEGNLLAPGPESCRQVAVPYPVLTGAELARLRALPDHPGGPRLRAVVIDGLFPASEGGEGLRRALVEVGARASAAIASGAGILVLSDRRHTAELAPIPSLLLTAAVHHHLVQQRTRTRVALVVEAGDAREVHHLALLLGYGAGAVHPYLALQSVAELAAAGDLEEVLASQAVRNYVQAVGKGVLKVMSKMGISTLASYTGAQVFEVLGLADAVVDAYFSGTPSRLGGVGLDVLAAEVVARHRAAYSTAPAGAPAGLGPGSGEYQWRRDGEVHLFDPETVFRLQHATRARRRDIFRAYTQRVDHPTGGPITLRSLLRLRVGERPPVPLEEVEPAASIMRRFATGAMSYGSISAEAHETLAVAMNRLGARSNSGEGGEDPERDRADPSGDSRRSRIRQVASARFGVTSTYLVGADDLQIKIAQGAKPGEGGQLPGHKVYPWIARTRHSVPGVGLISPAPHHDIYSIEDLAQLVLDLKSANPRARVHVKLVSQVGVGTVAAGVAKARADVILISGGDGGTGAAPLTSLKHAGAPWELGLAETQQTLLANGLRDRVTVQVDGQLRTGRDVVVAALLGAEEYGFATAALVVSGCVMMRVCHLNTCPVGIATQDPELRRLFTGRPEFVQTFFEYVAEEVREHLAALGLRTLDEAVGRVELLEAVPAVGHWKASSLDLSALLARPSLPADAPRRRVTGQDHQLAGAFDERLMERCRPALERGDPVELTLPVTNADRAVGTRLGHEVTRRHGAAGLPADTLRIHCRGSAGQSFGAFLPPGITLLLEGDANDYVGKGLSGGRLVLRPPPQAPFAAEANVIAGNVALYGATAGELFVCGRMGERFAVRNSGATAVVEGVGNHGCEYMTGGRVVVLGPTGRNFAAGMSGGAAFVLDADGTFAKRCNLGLVTLEAPAAEDASWLRAVLERHHALTGSPVAARVLAAGLGRMVKVMPTELQRLLRAEAATVAAAADG